MEKELKRAINSKNDNVIACYHQDVLCGLCAYFWNVDEKYSQTLVFLIRDDYDKTADEYKNNGIEGTLINEMLVQLYNEVGCVKEILFFIDEDCDYKLNIALNAGFKIKEKYRCYKWVL